MVLAQRSAVLAEADIENPVKAVLYAPARIQQVRKRFRQCHCYPRQKPRVAPISLEPTSYCHNPWTVNDFFSGFTTSAYAMPLSICRESLRSVTRCRMISDNVLTNLGVLLIDGAGMTLQGAPICSHGSHIDHHRNPAGE